MPQPEGYTVRHGLGLAILTTERFLKWRRLLVCLVVMSFVCLEAGGCARLKVIEKETHDPKTDTYTTKYKKLPEWSEYVLGTTLVTVVGSIWGLMTLCWLVPSKSKPEPQKTKSLAQEEMEKAEAKADYMLDTHRGYQK